MAQDPGSRRSFADRLRSLLLRPAGDDASGKGTSKGAKSDLPESVPELQQAIDKADDKERAIGLVAAPLAMLIAFIVPAYLVSHDPATTLANGAANPKHVSVGLYHEIELVLVVLAILMLVFALLRKRLFLGIVLALFGLAVFNLHYWGFGIPFLLAGAWYLYRSYRLQRGLKEAGGRMPTRAERRSGELPAPPRSAARKNKRYTPPTSPPSD